MVQKRGANGNLISKGHWDIEPVALLWLPADWCEVRE